MIDGDRDAAVSRVMPPEARGRSGREAELLAMSDATHELAAAGGQGSRDSATRRPRFCTTASAGTRRRWLRLGKPARKRRRCGRDLGADRADRGGHAERDSRGWRATPSSGWPDGTGQRHRLGARHRGPFASPAERGRDCRGPLSRGDRAAGPHPATSRARPRAPALRGVVAPRGSPCRRARAAAHGPRAVHARSGWRRSPSAPVASCWRRARRSRKRTVETRDDLTAQERQIAELARDGLSNPEIGARLFLSPRTVEWHLRKVFAKLGIRSRHELAGALGKPRIRTGPGLIPRRLAAAQPPPRL